MICIDPTEIRRAICVFVTFLKEREMTIGKRVDERLLSVPQYVSS